MKWKKDIWAHNRHNSIRNTNTKYDAEQRSVHFHAVANSIISNSFQHLPLRQFGYRTGQLECGRFPSCCSVVFWTFSKYTAIIELTTRYTLTRHESPETNMPWKRRPLQIFKLRHDRGERRGEIRIMLVIGRRLSPATFSPANVSSVANCSVILRSNFCGCDIVDKISIRQNCRPMLSTHEFNFFFSIFLKFISL